MASSHDNLEDAQGRTTNRKDMADPYTVAQISLASATQTTVVTTTTTTTTSFPPLLMKAPRHLTCRDPKLYPLAAAATPSFIKHLGFSIHGKPALFEEADNPEKSLQEFQQQHASIQASKGVLCSVTNSQTQYETPTRMSGPSAASQATLKPSLLTAPLNIPANRAVSPPSIREAAELASLKRQSKRKRGAVDETAPVTPNLETGSSGEFKIPKINSGLKEPGPRGMTNNGSLAASGERSQSASQIQPRSRLLSAQPKDSHVSNGAGYSGTSHYPILLDEPAAGVSATPPIAESDLEPIIAFEQDNAGPSQIRRPSPLDTSSAQDASLPSPSLSPITAAANLANSNAFAKSALEEREEDAEDVSSLDLSQEGLGVRNVPKLCKRRVSIQRNIDLPDPLEDNSPNPQLPTPTIMEIPTMLNAFDAMPNELQTYVMYQLLRRCAKSTLHFVADVVNPALRIDFLGLLPAELSLNIVKYLDFKSMCRAAQVSKKWRQIIDSDEKAWRDLLEKDGYDLPDGEIQRAVREGWGWQDPHGTEGWEKDLNTSGSKSDGETSPKSSVSLSTFNDSDGAHNAAAAASRPKRKAASKAGGQKKRRKTAPALSKMQSLISSASSGYGQGPIAYAKAAEIAVPNPEVGLPDLTNMHLFKSLYRRHHQIRKSWMDDDAKPYHLAFRAHQRHVVTCLQFDTDKILTGSDDTNINVYDTKSGVKRKTLEGHEGGVWALQYEGNILVSGSTDRSVRVWDIEKGRCLQVFQGHTSTVRCLVILKPTEIGTEPDGTPIMMPKEPLIITGSRDSTLRVWKLPQPGDRSIFQAGPPTNDRDNPYFVRALTGHHHSVRAIAAHGDTLISGSYDCSVRVWKISTGDVLHRLQGHTQKVYSVVLDQPRNRCISGSMDNLVKVWSLDTGACLFNLEGHTSLVGLLDLSHGRLVSAAADSTLRIWDPENGQCKSTLSAHTGAITCFQHDGQKVISGSDRTLKMWNVRTGECVKDLLTDLSGVWQVKFNERRCVAAVQRNNMTYIEVLDFGAARDGVPANQRGVRIVVDRDGREIEDLDDTDGPEVA